MDEGQGLAQIRGVLAFFELGAHFRGELVEVGVNIVEAGVGLVERLRCLLTNALYAGDVVRRIADQGFIVHHQPGRDAKLGDHICVAGIFFRVSHLAAFWQADDDMVADQLQQVAVAGDNAHAQALRGGLFCH